MYPNVERSRLGVTRWGPLDPLPRTIRAGLSSWCAIAKRDGKCNIMVRVLAREIPTPSSQSSRPGVVQEKRMVRGGNPADAPQASEGTSSVMGYHPFTVDEANAMLPEVRVVLNQIQDLRNAAGRKKGFESVDWMPRPVMKIRHWISESPSPSSLTENYEELSVRRIRRRIAAVGS